MAKYFQMLFRTQISAGKSLMGLEECISLVSLSRIVSEAILCLKPNGSSGEIRSCKEMRIVNITISVEF